jgi:hypothetical protein
MEKKEIYRAIGLPEKHRLEPQVDFPNIIALIERKENGLVVSAAEK